MNWAACGLAIPRQAASGPTHALPVRARRTSAKRVNEGSHLPVGVLALAAGVRGYEPAILLLVLVPDLAAVTLGPDTDPAGSHSTRGVLEYGSLVGFVSVAKSIRRLGGVGRKPDPFVAPIHRPELDV